jgi:hypothetical protein
MRVFVLTLSFAVLFSKSAQAQKWYETMDVGPAWMNTFKDHFNGKERIGAIKGLSVDLGEGWRALYDTETLRLCTVYKGGVKWGGTPWAGGHGTLITMQNQDGLLATATGSGWADSSGSFEDKRPLKGYGDMAHGAFKGHYLFGRQVVLDYEVSGTTILEHISNADSTVTRSFGFGPRNTGLTMVVADADSKFTIAADSASAQSDGGLKIVATGGIKLVLDSKNTSRLLAVIPAGKDKLSAQIAFGKGEKISPGPKPDFKQLTSGGAGIWKEILTTQGKISEVKDKPYLTDLVTIPATNPWNSKLRFGGFDFIDEDSAALSTWNGDVWVVRGLKGDWKEFKWQRIASGLFETLGVKVVKGAIYVNGRDQITKLIDLNGDGETDRFMVFNRDVYVSPNFHEFAFDLQTDQEGNFYFSKSSPVRAGGRGFDEILPHHGIIAKISPDGKKFEVIATGIRAPGGLGIGPEGQITIGENEGTWQPCCKISAFNAKSTPVFLGTEPSRHSLKHAPYTEPLVYLPMDVDNSSGSQVWVPDFGKFGLKTGDLMHLSYGQSSIYRVLPVMWNGKIQGGVVKLPISLQSSAMRARFHQDGSMYVVGFRGWQTNAASECAFQRIRHNAEIVPGLPEKIEYTAKGVNLTFPVKLDKELAEDPTSYSAQRWDYVRGPQYGSGEFSVDAPDQALREKALVAESKSHHKRDDVKIAAAKLSKDEKTVELELEGMKPSMSLKVSYDLEDSDGEILKSEIHATVYGGK